MEAIQPVLSSINAAWQIEAYNWFASAAVWLLLQLIHANIYRLNVPTFYNKKQPCLPLLYTFLDKFIFWKTQTFVRSCGTLLKDTVNVNCCRVLQLRAVNFNFVSMIINHRHSILILCYNLYFFLFTQEVRISILTPWFTQGTIYTLYILGSLSLVKNWHTLALMSKAGTLKWKQSFVDKSCEWLKVTLLPDLNHCLLVTCKYIQLWFDQLP